MAADLMQSQSVQMFLDRVLVSYVERPGRTSPPFPDHNMRAGQELREGWFPVLFQRQE